MKSPDRLLKHICDISRHVDRNVRVGTRPPVNTTPRDDTALILVFTP